MAEETSSEEEIYYVEFRSGWQQLDPIFIRLNRFLSLLRERGQLSLWKKWISVTRVGVTSILNKEYEIKKGDIVRIPAGLIHWHGAIKGEDFSHIAIRKKN